MTLLPRRPLAVVASAVATLALLPITAAADTGLPPDDIPYASAAKTAPPLPLPAQPEGLTPPVPHVR